MSEEIEIRRKHSWVALVTYRLSERQARASFEGSAVTLDKPMEVGTTGPVCYYCAVGYGQHEPACSGSMPS